MFSTPMSLTKKVILRGLWPPIDRMDDSLYLLQECEVLSISLHTIENISHLTGLRYLKVLSLAQNKIKSLYGLECVADTLEVLIIARNLIKETKPIELLNKLKKLDISHNLIEDPMEFMRITFCKSLLSLAFKDNPLADKFPTVIWREIVLTNFPRLDTYNYIKVEEYEKKMVPTTSEIYRLKAHQIINIIDCTEYINYIEELKYELRGWKQNRQKSIKI